ncbi:hypothetical protein BP6252_07303 [Coleophoma cylindrospora]|uniref:FAD dependent oxidoreductase domain-containing protein n=1 Tax=Coleophoma cylindrospora TaxID=1849047 RepID=A0A3D8RHG8_9HELO|nr:hypothetical protein BP6252_07303 [Coleophoma cylindrospora]
MADTNITVIGAGVTGLTTAFLLSKNKRNKITLVAKFMPGDFDIEYTSPWAGANFLPMGAEGSDQARYEANTWPWLSDLAKNHPEAGIHFQQCKLHTLAKDIGARGSLFAESRDKLPWWKDVVPDFVSTVGSDGSILYSFTSVCINIAIYLPWLLSKCLEEGVKVRRGVIGFVTDAADLHHNGKADIVINCTGLQSRKLGGVEDKSLVAVRGQTVLVRNDGGPMFGISSIDNGGREYEGSYSMTRAAGGGTILGGTFDPTNESPIPDLNIAVRIMEHAVKLNPHLTGGTGKIDDLDIVRHGVGLRPLRPQGPRVGEVDVIRGIQVVHSYGHGSWGYQGSMGSAKEIERVVAQIEAQKRTTGKVLSKL